MSEQVERSSARAGRPGGRGDRGRPGKAQAAAVARRCRTRAGGGQCRFGLCRRLGREERRRPVASAVRDLVGRDCLDAGVGYSARAGPGRERGRFCGRKAECVQYRIWPVGCSRAGVRPLSGTSGLWLHGHRPGIETGGIRCAGGGGSHGPAGARWALPRRSGGQSAALLPWCTRTTARQPARPAGRL